MPTEINTTEVASCLTNLGIWSYGVGGKVKTAYQQFYEICMATLGGATIQRTQRIRVATTTPPRTRTRTRTAATTPATGTTTPTRRRGRPPGPSAATRATTRTTVRKTENLGEIVLTAVSAAGTQRQILMANPTLKGVRPNHIGIAIARHLKAGRIVERDGMLYNTATEQRAAA